MYAMKAGVKHTAVLKCKQKIYMVSELAVEVADLTTSGSGDGAGTMQAMTSSLRFRACNATNVRICFVGMIRSILQRQYKIKKRYVDPKKESKRGSRHLVPTTVYIVFDTNYDTLKLTILA